MPRARNICNQCPNLQPCPDHTPKPWQGSNRKAELPNSRAWERTRQFVLDRDPVCTYCTRNLATEVHHIDDPADHHPSNLAGICRPCHKQETQRQAKAGRAKVG